jgi:hypothetical protein
MGNDDVLARIREAERQARLEEAKRRADTVANPQGRRVRDDAPAAGFARGGEPLAFGADEQGDPACFLEGRVVRSGDVVEVFTNAANPWIRGRFDWSGKPDDPPKLSINVWDPHGARDEDGLPPWIGTMEAAIPRRAVLRWPRRPGQQE